MAADLPIAKPFPWRLYWVLLLATILSALTVVPVAREMLADTLSKVELPKAPLALLIFVGTIQNVGLLALIVWLGLKLSRSLDLRAPLLESWLNNAPLGDANAARSLKTGLITGTAVGIVLLVCLLLLAPSLPSLPFVIAARVTLWKRLLLCFYGGIYEEVFTRLFLLSLVAWIANRSWRKPSPKLSNRAFWFANIFVALIFGLGHLPSTSLFMPITPLVVLAALLLNGIAGVAFGFLYRAFGLESAMIAHFTADFVIYVAGASALVR